MIRRPSTDAPAPEAIDQLERAGKPDPLGAVVVAAKADLRHLDLEAVEIDRLLLRQRKPAAVEPDVAVGVDRQLLDLEGRPFEALGLAEERGQLAAQLDAGLAVFDLECDAAE